MPRTITVAAIQMEAQSAPTSDRLARAEDLVIEAADKGAELVVLPELFNIGYAYTDSNYRRAEALSGPTVSWMRDTAAYLNIHLAGSLLLLDQTDVYNSLLLCAPNQQLWRYDKKYPWGWERAYFRAGHRITIAETDLGRIGLMICWDTGHPELWRQYAGQIDLMVISSCPPNMTNPTYIFPNGDAITFDQMGPVAASLKNLGRYVFGDMVNEQTAWLGVPAVNTVGIGQIETNIPNSLLSFLSILPTAPWLMKYLPQAARMRVACEMVPGCKIVSASGHVVTELKPGEGEAFTLAEVSLADRTPRPNRPQPPSRLPFLSYLLADTMLPLISVLPYRYGLRRVWGKQMAPIEPTSRQWWLILAFSVFVAFVTGWLLGRPRR